MNKRLTIIVSISCVLLLMIILLTSRGTRADTDNTFEILTGEENREVAQNAVVNTAYAFYYRGVNLQYNNHTVYFTDRTQLNTSYDLVPEHINSQSVEYNDCGLFVENIYAETFATNAGNKYYVSQPLTGSVMVPQSAIDMHSNSAMYNEARKLNWYNDNNIKCAAVGSDNLCKENEYYEVVNDSTSSVGIYYFLNKNYVGDVKDNDPINVVSGLDVTKIDEYKLGSETATRIREQIQDILQVGDVIIYSRLNAEENTISAKGHVVIYVGKDKDGNDRFMHSYGGSYNFGTKTNYNEATGAIKYTKLCYNNDCSGNSLQYGGILDYCDDKTTSCQWQALRSNVYQIAVIRPINHILTVNSYGLSQNANARTDYPKLVRTKLASVNKHHSVNPGDKITYTFKITNNSTSEDYSDIVIQDIIPENTELVLSSCNPGNCSINGNSVSWNGISIEIGETKEYSYTVKVNSNTPLGTKIISNQTKVAGIKMNTITTLVNKTLTKSMQNKLITEVNLIVNDANYHRNYTRSFIQDVYDAVIGCGNNCNIGFDFKANNNTSNNILNYFYDISGETLVFKNDFSKNEFTNMYIDGMFGGYHVSDGNLIDYFVTDGRVNYFDNNMLMIGDVIVLYDRDYQNKLDIDTIHISGEKDMYLYLGSGKFATIPVYKYENGAAQEISNDDRRVTIIGNGVTNDDNDIVSRLIDSLIGQTAFVILRPSYSLEVDISSLKGDVNADGVVDIKDVRILAKYIIEKTSSYSSEQLMIGDMNNDGKIKMNDVIKILKSL